MCDVPYGTSAHRVQACAHPRTYVTAGCGYMRMARRFNRSAVRRHQSAATYDWRRRVRRPGDVGERQGARFNSGQHQRGARGSGESAGRREQERRGLGGRGRRRKRRPWQAENAAMCKGVGGKTARAEGGMKQVDDERCHESAGGGDLRCTTAEWLSRSRIKGQVDHQTKGPAHAVEQPSVPTMPGGRA